MQLSDLLWADGYRICAVGGSDVHLKETRSATQKRHQEPARPGEPSTYLYMEGLSAAGFRDALKSCHAYVVRHCSLDFSCMLYDAEHQKLEGGWLFGDQLPKECRYLEYDLYTDRKSAGERELQPCIPYVIINGKKQLLQKESAEHAQSEIRYHGVLMLPDAPYVWIRFGAEDEDGGACVLCKSVYARRQGTASISDLWGCATVTVPVNVLSPNILCDDSRQCRQVSAAFWRAGFPERSALCHLHLEMLLPPTVHGCRRHRSQNRFPECW